MSAFLIRRDGSQYSPWTTSLIWATAGRVGDRRVLAVILVAVALSLAAFHVIGIGHQGERPETLRLPICSHTALGRFWGMCRTLRTAHSRRPEPGLSLKLDPLDRRSETLRPLTWP